MKTKIVFLLGLLLLSSTTVWAGWATQESTTTKDLNSICLLSNSIAFAAGADGTIIGTGNGGTTWEAKNTGIPGTVSFYSAMIASATEGYMLGNNGSIYSTSDLGASYTQKTVPAELSVATFKRGSFHGTGRAAVGSTATTSYYTTNINDANSWSAISSIEASGIYLATAEGTSYETYVWGKYTAGANLGQYVILKNFTPVYTTATQINDIFFPTKDVGYAVGASGLVVKTTDGGANWFSAASGLSADFNSVYFVTADFGWIVGDAGTLYYTTGGGSSWTQNNIDNTSVNIKSIAGSFVVAGDQASGTAMLSTSGGKIYKLASPTVTRISPTLEPQGWIGTFEITGSGFMAGATVNFLTPGTTTNDPALIAASIQNSKVVAAAVSVESSAKITGHLIVSPEATAGLRDVRVTNPDAAASTEANAFTVSASAGTTTLSNVWIDRNLFFQSPITITTTPEVSFEASSLTGMTSAAANAKIVLFYDNQYIFSDIPSSEITELNTITIKAAHTCPTLPAEKTVVMKLYAESATGVPGVRDILCVTPSPEGKGVTPEKGSTHNLPAVVLPSRNTWDPNVQAALPTTLNIPKGQTYHNIRVELFNSFGQKVWEHVYSDPKGFVVKTNFNINTAELPPYVTSGIYLIKVWDAASGGNVIAINHIVIADKVFRN